MADEEEKNEKPSDISKMKNIGKLGSKEEEKKKTEDVAKESKEFDAAKQPAPEEINPAAGPAKKPKPAGKPPKESPESGKDEQFEKLKKDLEEEKSRNKGLAEIIEKMSSASAESAPANPPPEPSKKAENVEPKLEAFETKIGEKVDSQIKEIKDTVVALGAKMQSVKPEKTGSKVKDMVDKMQADTNKKISELEEMLKKLTERATAKPKEETAEEVSKGLAVFGGRVDLKKNIIDLRNSIKEVEKGLGDLRDETETRITRLKEQIKVIEKIAPLEEKVESLEEKMGPENIEKMKKFIFSADEMTGHVIPTEIEKRITKELTPVFNDIKGVKDDTEKLREKIKTILTELNYFRTEIKTLYKFGDYIQELQSARDKLDEKISDKETDIIGVIDKLEDSLKKRLDLFGDRITDFEKIFTEKIAEKVKENFDDLTELRFSELEDRTEKNLTLTRAKMNDMESKFFQFQNVVNPTLSVMKEEIEKLGNSLEKVNKSQIELEEGMGEEVKDIFKELSGPQIEELRNETAKVLDTTKNRIENIESEFTQFQNVINPTLNMFKNETEKLDNRIEKLKTKQEEFKELSKGLKDMGKFMQSLSEEINLTKKTHHEVLNAFEKRFLVLEKALADLQNDFENAVNQSMIDRRKLESETKKQKERIKTLLKELKGS